MSICFVCVINLVAMLTSEELKAQLVRWQEGKGKAKERLRVAKREYDELCQKYGEAQQLLQMAQDQVDQQGRICDKAEQEVQEANRRYKRVCETCAEISEQPAQALQKECEEWAAELTASAGPQPASAAPEPASAGPDSASAEPETSVAGPAMEVKSEKEDDTEPLAEPQPQAELAEKEEPDHQQEQQGQEPEAVASASGFVCSASTQSEAEQAKINKLVEAAKRAQKTQAQLHEEKARQAISDAGLPQPPPAPVSFTGPLPGAQPGTPSFRCMVPCDCGARCTRIERMARIGRTYYKHRNHTCDECHLQWMHVQGLMPGHSKP